MVELNVYNLISESVFRVIAAIIILLLGLVIGRALSNLTKKLLHELEFERILKKQTKIKVPVEEFSGSLVKYIVYFIAIIMALNQIGLTTLILNIILVVILALLIVFIILAVKDFIPNVVAGFFLSQKDIIKKGDKIKVKDIEGKVVHINLVETKIKTSKDDIIFIPNSVLTKRIVVKKHSKK